MPSSPAAPQPLHQLDQKAWPRQLQQQEIWDDYAVAVFFNIAGTTVTVPMPFPGLIEVMASALLAGNAGLAVITLNLDGIAGNTATVNGNSTGVIVSTLTGVSQGSHTITLTGPGGGVTLSQTRIMARRGRAPTA